MLKIASFLMLKKTIYDDLTPLVTDWTSMANGNAISLTFT